jgi:hypothetical protein
MKYILLIYNNESDAPVPGTEAYGKYFQAYGAFSENLANTGKMTGGDALKPVSTATSVKVRGGKTITTDGPFAETKEQLGGFYIMDADNLDEAIEWAAKLPTAEFGTIEVRPVLVFEDM